MSESTKTEKIKEQTPIGFIDTMSKYYIWIIVLGGLLIKFLYEIMSFDKPIIDFLTDFKVWLATGLTLVLHMLLIGEATSKSVIDSLSSVKFQIADEKNDVIIKDVRNNFDEFNKYIQKLNENEKRIVQETFLIDLGKTFEMLDDDELELFKNLEYDKHRIKDFATPILYSKNKHREISYSANFDEEEYRKKGASKKLLTTFVFGALTFGISFTFDNVMSAFINLFITAGGLAITYLIYYSKPKYILQTQMPQNVKAKEVLWLSFKDYQAGQLKLKEALEVETVKVEEPKIGESKIQEIIYLEDYEPKYI